MRTHHRQRGMTMISWLMVAGIAAFLGKFGFALLPMYMEQARLDAVLDGTANEYAETTPTPVKHDLRRAVERRMGVNDVRVVRGADLQFKNEEGRLWIGYVFEQRVEFMGRVSLVVSYDNWVPIGGGGIGGD